MKKGDLFSISFHQGEVDFPYNLKIQVKKINNNTSQKCSYHFVALNKDDNYGNPDIKFITAFFAALNYLENDPNFSGLEAEYILPDENQKEIYFERIIHVNQPVFDSLLVTGYVDEDEVVINSLSCPPQKKD